MQSAALLAHRARGGGPPRAPARGGGPLPLYPRNAAAQALDSSQPLLGGGAGSVVAGSTCYSQYRFRGPVSGGSGFILSNDSAFTFCP